MAEGTSGEIAETRVAPGQRSRMAERTAIMRAAHRLLDAEPLVLDDPLAPVSSDTRAVLESAVRACERAGATVPRARPTRRAVPVTASR